MYFSQKKKKSFIYFKGIDFEGVIFKKFIQFDDNFFA